MEKLTDVGEFQAAAVEFMDLAMVYGLNLVTAVLILVAGFVLAGWVGGLIQRRLNAMSRFDKTLVPVLSQIARYAILVFTMVLVLAEFGVQTASIIAVLGAAGLAIGLALQGTLQNVAAGMMLLMLRPFQVGDFIATASCSGTVEEIGIFTTTMRTAEGVYVAAPNSQIWSEAITNYSRNPTRRVDVAIGISYEDDIDKARALLVGLAEQDERILKDPAPACVVTRLGESSVDLQLRGWARQADHWEVLCDLTREAKYAFDKAGITIPYPHREIITVKQ